MLKAEFPELSKGTRRAENVIALTEKIDRGPTTNYERVRGIYKSFGCYAIESN